MIVQVIVDGTTLTRVSPIPELMLALHKAGTQRTHLDTEVEALKFWLLRYALRMRPDERLDFSLKDEPIAVAIGKGADGRPFIFDGSTYWPSLTED
jgi:hypothetical protein